MFKEAIKLDKNWLANNMGYDMEGTPQFIAAKSIEYYINTCSYIREQHYLHPTMAQIDKYICDGYYNHSEKITLKCPIENAEERRYIFLSAQAKQLIYDFTSGRGAMLRGEDNRYNICADFADRIKLLGLHQRHLCTI